MEQFLGYSRPSIYECFFFKSKVNRLKRKKKNRNSSVTDDHYSFMYIFSAVLVTLTWQMVIGGENIEYEKLVLVAFLTRSYNPFLPSVDHISMANTVVFLFAEVFIIHKYQVHSGASMTPAR